MSKRGREEDVIGACGRALAPVLLLQLTALTSRFHRTDLTGGVDDVVAAVGRRVRLRVRAPKPLGGALLGAEDDSPGDEGDDDGADPDAEVSDGDSDGDDGGSDFEPEEGDVAAPAAPRGRPAAPSKKKAPAKGAKKPREGVCLASVLCDAAWVSHPHCVAMRQGKEVPRLLRGALEPRSSARSSCLTTMTTWKRRLRCRKVRVRVPGVSASMPVGADRHWQTQWATSTQAPTAALGASTTRTWC